MTCTTRTDRLETGRRRGQVGREGGLLVGQEVKETEGRSMQIRSCKSCRKGSCCSCRKGCRLNSK